MSPLMLVLEYISAELPVVRDRITRFSCREIAMSLASGELEGGPQILGIWPGGEMMDGYSHGWLNVAGASDHDNSSQGGTAQRYFVVSALPRVLLWVLLWTLPPLV